MNLREVIFPAVVVLAAVVAVNMLPRTPSVLLGTISFMFGALYFERARLAHGRVDGVTVTRGWQRLPSRLRWLLRADDGPLDLAVLPWEIWGLINVLLGLLLVFGVPTLDHLLFPVWFGFFLGGWWLAVGVTVLFVRLGRHGPSGAGR
jgi:hypothetical protein